jgi:hypothetical protein
MAGLLMNNKGYGRKWSWPNLSYSPGIHPKRVRNTMKSSVKIAILQADFPTWDLPNKKNKEY